MSIQYASNRLIVAAIGLLLAATLNGCSILPESAPVRLIDPRIDAEAGQHGAGRDWTLSVARPETDPVRDSNRVLVRTPDGQLQVHPTARWVAPAPELVRTALVRYLRDAELLAQVGASAAGSDRTLVIDLRRFELARTRAGALRVSVRADARLYATASADRLGRERFDFETEITAADGAPLVQGFEDGLESLADEVAEWLARH